MVSGAALKLRPIGRQAILAFKDSQDKAVFV